METNLMKGVRRISARIVLISMLLTLVVFVVCAFPVRCPDFEYTQNQETTESGYIEETVVLLDEPVTYLDIVYEDFGYKSAAIQYSNATLTYLEDVEAAIASGSFTESAVEVMRLEVSRLKDILDLYEKDIYRYTKFEEEYFYAAHVWQRLRAEGFSEASVAGILGNMMWETGGGTLTFKPTAYSGCGRYYGLCQWAIFYNPDIADKSFDEQLNYLLSNIDREFEEFGFCYRKGFTYEDFKEMDNPEDAAYAFATVYERCASFSYGLRKKASRTAYDYFTGA